MKTILIILAAISVAALGFDDHSKRSALAETQLQLLRVTQERDAARQEHIPLPQPVAPLAWGIPRTITTATGQVFLNATIRGLFADGCVLINYGPNSIKLPNGSLNGKAMQEIIAAKPIPKPEKKIATPYRSDQSTPVSSMQRIGGG